MAESAITIALETVQDLLREEPPFLLGVRDEVEEIGKELERMKAFLEHLSTKELEEDSRYMALKWKEEIRKVAEEVDDVVKNFAKEVKKRRSRANKIDDLKRLACFVNDQISFRKKRSELISAIEKITNLRRRLMRSWSKYFREGPDSAHERGLTCSLFDEDGTTTVGMEEDISELVFQLVNEETQCQVVSICGMGGVGKTTLAKILYNHPEVQRCFDRVSWTCLSQTQERIVTLKVICRHVSSEENNHEVVDAMTEPELLGRITEVLEEKKCLIVIDDIWTIDAWNSLRCAILSPTGMSKAGSKVLLTTQNKEVGLQSDYLHEVMLLTEEASWDLLQRTLNRNRRTEELTIDPAMEEQEKMMVRHCMGLPFAVKVLGGILIMIHTHRELEMLLQDFKRYLTWGNDMRGGGIVDVLGYSYNKLPNQLKQCFLFFGKFPYNFEIKATRLYHLWIAERIVSVEHQREGETMMDVAKRSLDELLQFYMVQVGCKEGPTTRKVKSCRVHNLMIDLCLSKLESNNDIKQGRTIYYNSDQHDNDDVGGHLLYLADQRARRVRSLVFFRGGEEFWDKTEPNLKNFQFLRVLDLEGVEMKRENLPESIGNLVELRYLSLRCTSSSLVLWKLPSSIINLQYLQILDLRTPVHPLLVDPDILCKLQQLAHLYLPKRINFDREKRKKLRLGGMRNLETLVNFNSNYCHVEDLGNLSKLRKLKAEVWEGFDYLHDLLNIITSEKTLLKESKLKIMGFMFHSKKELETLNKLFGCHHLCKLDLQGPISTLPGHNHFSQCLTDLNLWGSGLKEDPMPTLEKLPYLFSLRFGRDVYMGKKMVSSASGFPQLRTLVLACLPNLVDWEVNERAFPKLSKLEIHSCKKLATISDGLQFVTTLPEVCFHDMPEEFESKFRATYEKGKKVEDCQKVRRNPKFKFYYTVDRTRMERAGTEKNGKIIEQASAETSNRISEMPESSQTILSFREHFSTEAVGPDGHGRVQTFCLGPFPADMFSKPSRQYDAIKRTNEEQAAKIEMMEEEIKLWKERNDLMEKKFQNLENHILSRDKMIDLPRDANTNSRQVASVSEIEPWN